MAVKNQYAVYINGINITNSCVLPLKWANLLDEQLDECYLSIRHSSVKNFKPLTPVEIHLKNSLYYGNQTIDEQKVIKRFVVANDTNVTENPIGSNLWDHDIYLIEITKIMECIVVDTITFTNDLGRLYSGNIKPVEGDEKEEYNLPAVTPESYLSPLPSGTYFTFFNGRKIYPYLTPGRLFVYIWTQKITHNNEQIDYRISIIDGSTGESGGDTDDFRTVLEDGTYEAYYELEIRQTVGSETVVYKNTITYSIIVVTNRFPLKKWTITDVIRRTLDLCEPIRQGEKPRFRLQGVNEEGVIQEGSQAAKFDQILAPQFSFTKQTLRECLQECGKVIHGEPRLDIKKDSDGKFYYEVSFDLYGQAEKSHVFHKKYIKNTVSQVIDSYASHLDSNAENLVNQTDKLTGVIIEPYRGGYKSVRTEMMYVRITDANMLIPTQYPIYSIEKLECGYITGFLNEGQNIDLTAWVFESSVYNSQLSSFDSKYPYSKAYGLSYTQGQKNISALNFKPENPIDPVFEKYAIINILRQATGNPKINLYEYNYNPNDPESTQYSQFPLLAFRVTYTPFYNARVGQTKTYYPDYPYGAALIYNQQSNVIESRYYGENLKGVIARIGNVEKSITYNLARLADIPKAGQMYNDDYYISAVSVEYLPTYIKCTIGLSKDFNRLSQYIGISSVKRFSEVSQSQAVERNLLFREYIVVGKEEDPDSDSLIGDNFLSAISNTFIQEGDTKSLTNIVAWGSSYKNYNLPVAQYSVISSAFGNSISFAWRHEDNYSAGSTSQYKENTFYSVIHGKDLTVSGYFQNNYQYTDYYGKSYYYNFDLQEEGEQSNAGNQDRIALGLPQSKIATSSSGYFSTVGLTPYILRKDNREALQGNIQIDFVTNVQNLIIGSALAAYCPLVRGVDKSLAAKLYVFDEPLNKFINHVQGSLDVDLSTLPSMDIAINTGSGKFSVTAGKFPANGKAWAIVTQQSPAKEEMVEDEEGNVFPQSEVKGGDVLIAQNMEISAGQQFTPIYFTKKRKIFKEDVWTEIR